MNSSNLKKIAEIDWNQRWSGSYTFLSCSFWGPQYYKSLKKILGANFTHTLFVHRKGTVDFYVSARELHHLGRTLAKRTERHPNLVKKYSRLIKNNTDALAAIMKKISEKIPTWQEYQKFLTAFENHLAYHGFIKETVDYLRPGFLKSNLRNFEDARKYSEKIYSLSESCFRSLAGQIGRKEKIPAELLTCLTQTDLETYLVDKSLPAIKLLHERYRCSCLYFEYGRKSEILQAKQVKTLERKIVKAVFRQKNRLTGISAFAGSISGICRVVADPRLKQTFNKGDILVTGMTRPEFLPFIHKASAIITDSGGILSHAAIIARELNIPCIVGTQVATKILKSGQKIQIDGKTGIIKTLK